jgi:hypothetical protein
MGLLTRKFHESAGSALEISGGLSAARSRIRGIAVCSDMVGPSGANISRFAKYSG